MDANNAFLSALAGLKSVNPKEVEFRIYYDKDSGEILNYTNEDLPGEYILVDKETFARHRFDCLIRNGKIIPYRLPLAKLIPSDHGVACVPGDVTILADSETSAQFWRIKTYEQD